MIQNFYLSFSLSLHYIVFVLFWVEIVAFINKIIIMIEFYFFLNSIHFQKKKNKKFDPNFSSVYFGTLFVIVCHQIITFQVTKSICFCSPVFTNPKNFAEFTFRFPENSTRFHRNSQTNVSIMVNLIQNFLAQKLFSNFFFLLNVCSDIK